MANIVKLGNAVTPKMSTVEMKGSRVESFFFDGVKTVHLNQIMEKGRAPIGSFVVAVGGVEQPFFRGNIEVVHEGGLYIIGTITGEYVEVDRL